MTVNEAISGKKKVAMPVATLLLALATNLTGNDIVTSMPWIEEALAGVVTVVYLIIEGLNDKAKIKANSEVEVEMVKKEAAKEAAIAANTKPPVVVMKPPEAVTAQPVTKTPPSIQELYQQTLEKMRGDNLNPEDPENVDEIALYFKTVIDDRRFYEGVPEEYRLPHAVEAVNYAALLYENAFLSITGVQVPESMLELRHKFDHKAYYQDIIDAMEAALEKPGCIKGLDGRVRAQVGHVLDVLEVKKGLALLQESGVDWDKVNPISSNPWELGMNAQWYVKK